MSIIVPNYSQENIISFSLFHSFEVFIKCPSLPFYSLSKRNHYIFRYIHIRYIYIYFDISISCIMRSLEKICGILFNIICILGCGYQLQNIISAYFEFRSVTKIKFDSPGRYRFSPITSMFFGITRYSKFD